MPAGKATICEIRTFRQYTPDSLFSPFQHLLTWIFKGNKETNQ